MNYQKEPPKRVLNILKKRSVEYYNIDYFAYPVTFPSTAGPCGGCGGQSMSTFTVECYVCNSQGPTIYVCCGTFIFEDKKFVPFNIPKGRWAKLTVNKLKKEGK